MARTPVTRTIGGLDVSIVKLKPRAGFKLAAQLFKYLAPVLGTMQPTDEVSVETLTPALMAIMRDLNDAELDKLTRKVFEGSWVVGPGMDGKPRKFELNTDEQIDQAFDDNLMGMLNAMKFALEVNFASFFDGSAQSALQVVE